MEENKHTNFTIEKVVKSFFEALDLGSFDYIILAHKALSLSTIPEGLQSLITSQATIVILQNGVGTEEVYSKAFPGNTIITSAVSRSDCERNDCLY